MRPDVCLMVPAAISSQEGNRYEEHRLGISATRRARPVWIGGTLGEQLVRRPRAGSSARKRSPIGFMRLRVLRRTDAARRLGAFGTRFGPEYALTCCAPLCGARRAVRWRRACYRRAHPKENPPSGSDTELPSTNGRVENSIGSTYLRSRWITASMAANRRSPRSSTWSVPSH